MRKNKNRVKLITISKAAIKDEKCNNIHIQIQQVPKILYFFSLS